MAQLTQATPRNYWISPNALFIQLNAMGTPDYIQASCTSGAQILVYVKDIIPYDAGHNYQRWPLQASPTVFNSHTEKYVYVAVPRSDSSQKEAVVVFPSEEIDIYGKNENAEQIGDEKYYYIFLQGIITSSGDNGTTPRNWKENCRIATGYLSSDEAISAGPDDSEWFSFSPVDNFTTFLKDLTMKAGTKFRELFAKAVTIVSGGSITFEGQHTSLSGVADETTAAEAVDRIVTPKYMDDHALSSVHDDVANGLITFLQGLQVGSSFVSGLLGTGGVFRKDADGKTYIEVDKIYARVKAIFDNVEIRNFQHTSGNRIVSVAGMTIVRVENVDANGNNDNIGAITTAYRCYFRGKDGDNICTNDFVVGDLAFCSKTSVDENLTHKRYWRAVIRKSNEVDINGNHWIDLSVDDCEKDSDIPSVGDDVSQLGNKTKTERQGVIIEMSSGEEAPCYQIFQGINDYTLEKKCMIDLGYNSATGRAKMNVYGDTYIGDVDENTFLRYDSLSKTLEIKAKIDAKSTIGDRDIDKYIKDNTLSSDDVKYLINNSEIIGSLQNQIDGAIETWYYEGEPTLENLPAQGWTDDDTKNKHIGDLYYDKASGKGYRFLKDETGAYIWAIITDEDITKALALAGEKKRIFGTTPTPPYDVDDLWVYAVYQSDGIKYNKDILRCITAKSAGEKFSIDDWALASDYATNTKVAQLDYLKDALKNDTAINGGLILSTLVALRDKSKNIQSGINGAVQDAKYKGGGIAAWYGGEMGDIEDKSNYPGVTNWAKSLLRFDGSGYLANGNISWEAGGKVNIEDLHALINDADTNVLNIVSSIYSMFSTRVKESETLILPKLRFGNLFIERLRQKDLDNNDVVLTQKEIKERFVTIDWFNKVFSVVDDKQSDLPVNGNISSGASIRAKMSLWSDGGISALGNSASSGGSGGGGLMGSIVPYAKAISLTTQNEGAEIASAWSVKMLYDKIENVDVSGQLTSYLTKQEAQSLYQPIGNYLTAHQDISGKADRSELLGYLPLTGGTLTGNLNLGGNTLFAGDISIDAEEKNWNLPRKNSIKLLLCRDVPATGSPSTYISGVSILTNYVGFQLASYGGWKDELYFRKIEDNNTWHDWYKIYHEGFKPTKSDVGLGNVDNTADANKSVNYATTSGSANSVAWVNVSGRPTSMPASDVYAWAKAATKPNYTYDEIKVKGLVNVADFTRVVIALCEVTKSQAYTGTFSSGEILYYRTNGVIPIEYARVNFIDSYFLNYDAKYSLETSTENESKDKPISSIYASAGFRKCTFVYNGKHYAGVEVYFSQAASYYWRGYSHGHTVFGVIVEQNNTVKNEEIYNSLSYDGQDRSGISFGNVRANSFAKKDSSDSYVLLGGGGHALISSLSVATAAKLQTARTIWGQRFDGTSNVSGTITGATTITASGRVTASEFKGNFVSDGTVFYFGNSANVIGNGTDAVLYAYGGNNLLFYTNGTNRMVIEGGGNVGIGTTSPTHKLHVNGDMATTGRAIVDSLQIGNITIIYDAANKGLRIAGGGLYTDSYLSSLGVDASTALSVKKYADSIQITTESDSELATAYSIGNLYRLINSNQKTITQSLNQSVGALQGRCTSLEQRVSALENKVNK